MNKLFRAILISVFTLAALGTAFAYEGATPPKAQTPLLITTAGQGPGGEIVNVLATRNRISPSRLVARANTDFLQDNKTLFIVLSSSLKGMGAAGVSIDQELARLDTLIAEAKKKNMMIVGAHLEGDARRGGYDEDIIQKVAPKVDYLIVRSDGNADGIFNKIAQANNIPLSFIEKSMELNEILVAMFK